MSVTYTNPRGRGQDTGGDVAYTGSNYETGKLTIGYRHKPSGDLQIFEYERAELTALLARVPQAAQLRLALEQDLIAQGKVPPGTAT